MVTTSEARWRNQRGKVSSGCLFTLLIVAVVIYYGAGGGSAYIRYWRMKDAMTQQARLGPSLDDPVIRRRLQSKAEELDLPNQATNIRIRRLARPREIVITTVWKETIDLPFYDWVVTFRPEARALL
jgi:hypothetical protein